MTHETMTERPIIFSGESVLAILDGIKSQTRRVVKPQPAAALSRLDVIEPLWSYTLSPDTWRCPYGQPGDLLWVREALCARYETEYFDMPGLTGQTIDGVSYGRNSHTSREWSYAADNEPLDDYYDEDWSPARDTVSPIYMPKWACRLRLRVTGVRVERVQEISEPDAAAEGMKLLTRYDFKRAWNSLNAKRGFGWDTNPWVFALEFEQIEHSN